MNTITPMVDPDIPNSKVLSTTNYIPQPDSTTCGPTSAHNLLLNWGQNVSLDTLKIDLGYNGGTPFSDKWPTTLNKWANTNYYVITWGPSTSDIWYAFVGDTLDNHPFILDTHMNTSNGYLVGYPSGSEYWHYVTGNGYSGYYNTTQYGYYFDPYNGRAGTHGEHSLEKTKWYSLVYERGIVW